MKVRRWDWDGSSKRGNPFRPLLSFSIDMEIGKYLHSGPLLGLWSQSFFKGFLAVLVRILVPPPNAAARQRPQLRSMRPISRELREWLVLLPLPLPLLATQFALWRSQPPAQKVQVTDVS